MTWRACCGGPYRNVTGGAGPSRSAGRVVSCHVSRNIPGTAPGDLKVHMMSRDSPGSSDPPRDAR